MLGGRRGDDSTRRTTIKRRESRGIDAQGRSGEEIERRLDLVQVRVKFAFRRHWRKQADDEQMRSTNLPFSAAAPLARFACPRPGFKASRLAPLRAPTPISGRSGVFSIGSCGSFRGRLSGIFQTASDYVRGGFKDSDTELLKYLRCP